ncbi:transcription termination/antitermination protein NusA, partial [Francisella tularensis subsp. holarctica]|uniref:NusA N-terminal domain-containing protein n=1 Tax=Francisella tularensis TaxID=263 RepID=UPI002381A799
KIDRVTGDYKADRVWQIVSEDEDLIDYSKELYEDVVQEKCYNVKAGDVMREPVEIKEYGRIAATIAKQILMKKIKNFEIEKSARFYQNKIGDIVYG